MDKAQLKKADAAPNKEDKLNQLSKLLDEAIAEYETLCKAELMPQELSLQPDAQGDMAAVAHQMAAPLAQEPAKEEPKAEEKPEEKKEEVKKEEMPEEKPEEKKDEEKEEEKEEKPEEDEEKDEEMEKFEALLSRTLAKWGLFKAEDEEEAEEEKEEDEEKKKKELEEKPEEKEEVKKTEAPAKDDTLLKSLDGRMEKFEDALLKLTERMEKIARLPVSERKSLSALQPIRKSMEEGEQKQISKGQVIDKLLDLQKGGDNRVTPHLVTQFEMTGDYNLVKELIR